MTLPGKGSRGITVDGTAYRWLLRGRPAYDQGLGSSPLTYTVEQNDTAGATLVVMTKHAHPSNRVGQPAGPAFVLDQSVGS